MTRRIARALAVFSAACALSLLGATAAHADPAFGPGNGEQGGNQKCHPPGTTTDVPGCK